MELAALIKEFLPAFREKYSSRLRKEHLQAIDAILRCRTPDAGEVIAECPKCHKIIHFSHSCGNRSCPRCQNHETGTWIDRQRQKLLPVSYYLVTFTVPASLRSLARTHQRMFFECLFKASEKALRTLGNDPRFLGGNIGMTGVLHTHSRKLDFHPHVHYLVPGGAFDKKNRLWKSKNWKFLFPEKALAKIFRNELLTRVHQEGFIVPGHISKQDWVVNCKRAGSGEPALKYLSRYLYRGIIPEKNIIRSNNGIVTFRYREGKSRVWKARSLRGEDFLWLVLQHVLPKGFRRVRDFGFLHGNARKILRLIQLLLHAKLPIPSEKPRPIYRCPACCAEMNVIAVAVRRVIQNIGPP